MSPITANVNPFVAIIVAAAVPLPLGGPGGQVLAQRRAWPLAPAWNSGCSQRTHRDYAPQNSSSPDTTDYFLERKPANQCQAKTRLYYFRVAIFPSDLLEITAFVRYTELPPRRRK